MLGRMEKFNTGATSNYQRFDTQVTKQVGIEYLVVVCFDMFRMNDFDGLII